MSNYKYPILAKPSGITLEQHTQDVVSEGKLLLEQTPFIVEKYQERVGKSLSIRLERACQYHDLGKKTTAWQDACQKDYEAFLQWQSHCHYDSLKKRTCHCHSKQQLRHIMVN